MIALEILRDYSGWIPVLLIPIYFGIIDPWFERRWMRNVRAMILRANPHAFDEKDK